MQDSPRRCQSLPDTCVRSVSDRRPKRRQGGCCPNRYPQGEFSQDWVVIDTPTHPSWVSLLIQISRGFLVGARLQPFML